jgi:hypothetical protein
MALQILMMMVMVMMVMVMVMLLMVVEVHALELLVSGQGSGSGSGSVGAPAMASVRDIRLLKDGLELPAFLVDMDYHAEGVADLDMDLDLDLGVPLLRVDTGRALFDTIVIEKQMHVGSERHCEEGDYEEGRMRKGECATVATEQGLLIVVDSGVRVWEGIFQVGFPAVETFSIAASIAAPPLARPRIVDVFPYNGDYLAPFRLQNLFDYVDEFIIVEAAVTFSGTRKPQLLFNSDENRAIFAPYMSKITYVVVEEFPPYPDSNWLQFSDEFSIDFIGTLNSMLKTPNFWRANYQRLFAKFFIRPPNPVGERQMVLVTDCDELPNRTSFAVMHDLIRTQHQSQRYLPIPLFMMFFYYNFNTVNPYSWRQAYVISTEGYLAQQDMLSPRVPLPDALPDQYIAEGGWHMSYFMSREEIRRKLDAIADQSFYNANPDFKSDQHILRCIQESRDLYLRSDYVSAAWTPRAKLRVTSFPAEWEELQRNLEQLQGLPEVESIDPLP